MQVHRYSGLRRVQILFDEVQWERREGKRKGVSEGAQRDRKGEREDGNVLRAPGPLG